jgi:hypothetical protein
MSHKVAILSSNVHGVVSSSTHAEFYEYLLTESPALFTQDSRPESSFSTADAHLLCSLSSEFRYLCKASLQHASPQKKQS